MSTIAVKKKPISAGYIVKAFCDFDYLSECFTLSFISDHIIFKPLSIKAIFRKQNIRYHVFEVDTENIRPPNMFSVKLSFNNIPIDFFGCGDRKFLIVYDFESTGVTYQSTFTFTLPVVMQNDLRFKAPGTTYPTPLTRTICKQGFKMNESNSDDEIMLTILLEEFKIVPICERYKAYGYVTMIMHFLDIENSFELDLVNKFNISDAHLMKVNAHMYKIEVRKYFYLFNYD